MQSQAIWPNINAELHSNEINVWLFESPATVSPALLAACRSLLTPTEQAYAAQKSAQLQQNYVIKQAFLRHVLAQYHSDCAPTSLSFTRNQHGKPSMTNPPTDLCFNLSHTEQWYALAVCLRRDIGVDVEVIKPKRQIRRIAEHYFHPQEVIYLTSHSGIEYTRRFYQLWTLKEAMVKAAGVGMSQSFNQFSVVHKPYDRVQTAYLCKAAPLCDKSWLLQQYWLNESLSLAIAVAGTPEDAPTIAINTLSLTSVAV